MCIEWEEAHRNASKRTTVVESIHSDLSNFDVQIIILGDLMFVAWQFVW
jgi:hypothetical protein